MGVWCLSLLEIEELTKPFEHTKPKQMLVEFPYVASGLVLTRRIKQDSRRIYSMEQLLSLYKNSTHKSRAYSRISSPRHTFISPVFTFVV